MNEIPTRVHDEFRSHQLHWQNSDRRSWKKRVLSWLFVNFFWAPDGSGILAGLLNHLVSPVKIIEEFLEQTVLASMIVNTALGSSMSFYPDFILILSWFYPDLSRFHPDFILILSRFYPDFLKTHFIQILSWFYPNFWKYLDKIRIKSG